MSSFYSRFISTLVMVALLLTMVLFGQRALIGSIYAIQVKIFKEVHGLHLFTDPTKDKKHQGYLDWYLFIIWSIWILSETMHAMTWLRLVCLVAYTTWFVASFLQFTLDKLVLQLAHFFWMHTLNLFTTTQVLVLSMNLNQGLYWFLLPISLVICNDIAAYLCGRWFGQTKLIAISPNKTVEGFLGAWVITMLFGCTFSCWLTRYDALFLKDIPEDPTWHGLALAMYASLAAPFGGFFASALKRAKGIKDFDQWIPGHGGMTDRMDCHLLMGLFTLVYLHTIVL